MPDLDPAGDAERAAAVGRGIAGDRVADVGDLVRRDPSLVAVMDRWIDSPDRWRARTAILHQLRFKHDTDVERLFRYCTARATEPEFFIRKAIGWALRQHAWTDPDAVVAFVRAHPELSALSTREALRNVNAAIAPEPRPTPSP